MRPHVVSRAPGKEMTDTDLERTKMICAPRKFARQTRSRSRRAGPVLAVLTATLLAAVVAPRLAVAQETTGRIVGRVTDMTTGQPLSGITVIVQGGQAEDAVLTDESGEYLFVNLRVGNYVVRFYNANSTTRVERPDVAVSAGATVRADAAIPSQAMVEETYVIKKRAAAVDVGSARLGMTIGEDYMLYIPVERTFGDLMLKAPGAFPELSGSVSIAGASGLENIYIMDGLNVTGLEFGDIMNRRPEASGGSNLSIDFIKELQINTGGYTAEYGGAMGGVVNVVTKSGSNEFHGSAFMYWAPYWLSGNPQLVLKTGSSLTGVDKPDYDTNIGFEVGGPIIKNKLFFWAGFAPRFEKQHFFRDVNAFNDANGDGVADVDANNVPIQTFLLRTRTRELRQSYQAGTKIDFLIAPEHRLTLGLFTTPTAGRHVRGLVPGSEAVNDPRWAEQSLRKTNTDINLTWVSQFLDRRLRINGSLGLHREDYSEKSPFSDLNNTQQREWYGASLYNLEGIAGCELRPYTNMMGAQQNFDPCPVDFYHNGGYGLLKSFTGNRWAGDFKATYLLNKNEIKIGVHGEYNTFDLSRSYSGAPGERVLIQNDVGQGQTHIWNFFSIPPGQYPFQFRDANPSNGVVSDLAKPPYYQDQLAANVKSINTAYFIQDTIRPVSNVIADIGVRFENQRLYDFRGNQFLNLHNLGPRLGVIYDPTNEGRSKIFAHYGRFFETIPMNLAARYFGGEGIAISSTDATCADPLQNWRTGGTTCPTNVSPYNAGANFPVQPNIKGQYHDEIVAGFRHAVTENLVMGVDYTHRWLGAVIEDGTLTGGNAALANPGNIPNETLDNIERDIATRTQEIAALPVGSPDREIKQAELGQLEETLVNLTGLAAQPKPQRTYDAVTFSASKRLARNWMVNASYTYSRLYGNYNGLYDADNNYFAPNGSNAYDFPELVLNKRGRLANDRPHSGRLDGFYNIPVGKGSVVTGLSFSAYSGVPRNHIGNLIPGQPLVFVLPRGSAGRTPTITQADVKVAYRRPLTATTSMEVFLDIYNVLNQRTAVITDDVYTFDLVQPIVGGTVNDLTYAKNLFGAPISTNPNFGKPVAYQAPIHGRIGLRLLF